VGQAALDPKELLAQLQTEHKVLRWGPLPPQEYRDAESDRQPADRSSLDYLHHHWALADTYEATHGGLLGRVITLFGRLTFKVLGPYLHQERELLARAVQVIDDLDQRCGDLADRYRELSDAVIDRQVSEAENQAKLALWLHLESPDVWSGNAHEGDTGGADEGDSASTS
jgi:hypothetical protein